LRIKLSIKKLSAAENCRSSGLTDDPSDESELDEDDEGLLEGASRPRFAVGFRRIVRNKIKVKGFDQY